MNLFDFVCATSDLANRTSEVIGGPFGDPFSEIGVISSVSDPKNLGRVQVMLGDGNTTDWAYVNGNVKGRLSSQYVGATCMVSKTNGNSAEAFVTQIFNKSSEKTGLANPIQVPLLSEQMEAANSLSDPGVRCDSDNVGRAYLFQNEISQDLAICLRRDNLQEGGEPAYAWKSLTHSKLVEKGFDTGVTDSPNITNLSGKVGIPKCSRVLEGEIREFTEDRKFRSTMMVCRRDENGDYGWMPLSAPPTVFRTTLPECTEKIHGMEAVIDPGDNSELAICLRYQGQMKWVHPGTRRPVQFFPGQPPAPREPWLASKKPIEALKSETAGATLSKSAQKNTRAATARITPSVTSDPALNQALKNAGVYVEYPSPEEVEMMEQEIVVEVLSDYSGVPKTEVEAALNASVDSFQVTPELEKILNSAPTLKDGIISGIESGDSVKVFSEISRATLNQSISSLPPQEAAVYSSYLSSGLLGAIDSAVAVGLNKLPDEVAEYAAPIWDIGSDLIKQQPVSMSNIIGAAYGAIDQTLPDSVNSIVSNLGGVEGITSIVSGEILSDIASGNYGDIAKIIGNFTGVPGIATLGNATSIPELATSALGLLKLSGPYTAYLGYAGLGLQVFEELTGVDLVSTLLGGIPGIGSLFGGGGLDCPCDPKCRKTSHGEDSDGNKLLDPCGNVIKSGHSSYSPSGNPLENNLNPITDFLSTFIGEDLCVKNPFDLTAILTAVKRLKNLADRMEGSKYADWPEFFSELIYSFEAIENAFQQTDNNITKLESIVRKLIDAQYRMHDKFFAHPTSSVPKLMEDVTEVSQGLMDLKEYAKLLNRIKDGIRVELVETPGLFESKRNIAQVPKLSAKTQTESQTTIENAVKPAHKEWKDLTPGQGLLELADIVLGLFNPDVPTSFNCKTTNTKEKVLKDSMDSKINSPVPPTPASLFESYLPEEYTSLPTQVTQQLTNPPASSPQAQDIATILDQITYEQGRAQEGKADC